MTISHYLVDGLRLEWCWLRLFLGYPLLVPMELDCPQRKSQDYVTRNVKRSLKMYGEVA